MHILEQKIREANKLGRYALIPFVTAGFPTAEHFWPIIKNLDDNGADIIEIGVPFSDPVADGPVVEEASIRALSEGMTLKRILNELKERSGFFKAGLVLMGYLNPFLQYGIEKLAEDAKKSGIHGFIIPDLPDEEAAEIKAIFHKLDLALIPLVGQNTSEERMQLYQKDALGYVYVVSVMGTTGEREKLAEETKKTLARANKVFDLPLALGFGLNKPEQIQDLTGESKPNALVFGSALLKHIDSGGIPAEFLRTWLK